MLRLLTFFVFLVVLAPIIILVVRTLQEKKIGKKEKAFSISFSVIGTILISSALFYSDLYTESLWFQSLGYDVVFWRKVAAQWALFAVFAAGTFLFLRVNALLLKRFLAPVLNSEFSQKIFNWAANIIPGVIAVIVGFISGNQWEKFLLFLNQVESGTVDPIFYKDVSFYLFSLPVQDYLSGLLLGFAIISAVALGISYLGFVRHKNQKFSAAGSIILIGFFGAVIWKFVLAPYHLLSQTGAIFYGADAADIEITLLTYKMVAIVSALGIVALMGNTIWRKWQTAASVFGVLVLALVFTGIAPFVFYKVVVEPNELAKEQEYIGYNIQYTRQAYGLDQIEEREFQLDISPEALTQDQETLNNVRLWDARALLSSYRKRQGLRPYYDFSGIDVDRYMIGGEYRQVMLAPRELAQEKLDPRSRTWVNEKLKFTHGYGVVLNAVNEFGVGGMPNLLLADIPTRSSVLEIKVARPEIYYGLLTRDYVIVKTTEQEFDYPQGDMNIYTTYQGEGGVVMGTGLRKLALALKFNDKDILLSHYLKAESQIMFRRQIEERIGTIAPFLKYDEDPYLVIDSQGKLWWMLDAYTVSTGYPYSEPYSYKGINYIRNSVKVVVNAYDGDVKFYVFDEEDPIIRTWMNVFPELFQPREEMPQDLIAHVRYPEDLLYIQAKMYRNYHVTDPQVFFQKEDPWQFGRELYESRGGFLAMPDDQDEPDDSSGLYASLKEIEALPQEVSPYYVIIRLPDNSESEFVQMIPFTPRDKDNLIGWIAGRADGANYGKVLVFKFSKQTLVYGPMQFEVRINQNTGMSEKFTLWSRAGSEVIRGNTLIIPIGNSLLYVEPIYIKADQSAMPEIKRIVVAMGDKLEWGDSFDEAIRKIIGLETSEQSIEEIIASARRHFAEYQRLTTEGKLSEAGRELEKLQQDLQRLNELIAETELTEE